jgi:hypothetical protein
VKEDRFLGSCMCAVALRCRQARDKSAGEILAISGGSGPGCLLNTTELFFLANRQGGLYLLFFINN